MNNDSFSQDQDIIDILKGGESKKAEYPPELFAARRKLFLEQLAKHPQFQAVDKLAEKDQKLLEIFRSLKSVEPEYPRAMLARRRSLYKQQISQTVPNAIWHVLRSSIQKFVAGLATPHRPISIKFARAASLALSIAMITFVAFALYGNTIQSNSQSNSPALSPTQQFTATPGQLGSPTPLAAIICADGDELPLCITVEQDKNQNVAYTGNGKARPAVAKDASNDHTNSAANLNDGLYGPSASWVSESPNSWIKIDLGTPTAINTVTFGRDRLGMLNAGDPGRFVIAVATSDDVYADGNSSNDDREYVQVFDSAQSDFDGTISGTETVIAIFDKKQARFIKITFENARTVIDEVEAFVSNQTLGAVAPTRTSSREDVPSNPSTALPVSTPIPSDTATAVPIDTLPPTDTVTPVPTDTAPPADTPTPMDTPTPVEPTMPSITETPSSQSDNASTAAPTSTSSASDGQEDPQN